MTISGCAARQPNEGGFDVMVKCPHISVCRIAIAVGRDRSDGGVRVASQANITIGVGKLHSPISRSRMGRHASEPMSVLHNNEYEAPIVTWNTKSWWTQCVLVVH